MGIAESVVVDKGVLKGEKISVGWWRRFLECQPNLTLRRGDSTAHVKKKKAKKVAEKTTRKAAEETTRKAAERMTRKAAEKTTRKAVEKTNSTPNIGGEAGPSSESSDEPVPKKRCMMNSI